VAVVLDVLPLLRDPDADHVVDGGAELAAAAALQEEDLVAIGTVGVGDGEEGAEGGFCGGEDCVGFWGAVGDFGNALECN